MQIDSPYYDVKKRIVKRLCYKKLLSLSRGIDGPRSHELLVAQTLKVIAMKKLNITPLEKAILCADGMYGTARLAVKNQDKVSSQKF